MGKSGKREGFLLGALMLSFSGLLVKISGLVFRVGITGLVDQNDAAMSHFSAAYSVYTFLLFACDVGHSHSHFGNGLQSSCAREI